MDFAIIRTLLTGGLFCLTAAAAPASTFNLSLSIDFTGSGLSSRTQTNISAAFDQAGSFWEHYILGYQVPDSHLTGIAIAATLPQIDGLGKTLGTAGVRSVKTGSNGLRYADSGNINFDAADVASLLAAGTLYGVLLHEIAHVIGFGTLWVANGLYVNGTGKYTGANALAKYNQEYKPTATYVPVEIATGRPGTDNSHWAETWEANGTTSSPELMTGFLGQSYSLSDTTLHAFRDLGYLTSNSFAKPSLDTQPVPAPVPDPVPAVSLLLALAGLAGMARRRTRHRHTASVQGTSGRIDSAPCHKKTGDIP